MPYVDTKGFDRAKDLAEANALTMGADAALDALLHTADSKLLVLFLIGYVRLLRGLAGVTD